MNQSRLDALLQYYKEDPNDPFTLYALALEYLNSEPAKSAEYFSKLLNDHEDYLPTYLHAGNFYRDRNDDSRAKMIYEKGMKLALIEKNQLALKELQSALNELSFEE